AGKVVRRGILRRGKLNSWEFGGSARDIDYEEGGRMFGVWGRMRRGIVTAALTVDAKEMLELANDRSHNLHEREMAKRYARVGLLCASHRHVSVDLARVGARLIEMAIVGKLFEIGEGEVGEGGVVGLSSGRKALMWRRLAECHAVVADGDGMGREEERWRESRDAWKEALGYLECATDQHCWESNIFVSISLGDYTEASNTLGILLRSFKSRGVIAGSGHSAGEGRGGSYNRLLAASLLMRLGKYEKAHSFIVMILERANEGRKVGEEEMGRRGHVMPPAPLTHLHLTFVSARCYEMWGGRGGGEGTQRAAEAGFRRCYGLLLESHDGTVSKVEHNKGKEGKMVKLADKAGGAAKGHVAELAKHTASLEFWLDAANVAFKGGDVAEAEKLCRVALARYPDSRRAKKAVKMLEKGRGKGGFDKAGSLKYMRKKGLGELMGLVEESAPLTVLEEKVRLMKEGGVEEEEEEGGVEVKGEVEEEKPKKRKKKAGFRRESQGLIEVKTFEG
ncbi:hypothetical protein TrRE_jg10320, partial [Triparma retinervis]